MHGGSPGQLARCLWSKLSDPSTTTFRDNAELWARFFLDLATGCAYTHRWHDVFAGFEPLSTSAIARSLVEAEARTAMAALCRLIPSDLNRVVSHFSTADARRAVEAATVTAIDPCRDVQLIADTLVAFEEWRPEDPKAQFALAVAIERETGKHAGVATLHLAEMLMDLAHSEHFTGSQGHGMRSDEDESSAGPGRTHPSTRWHSYLRRNRGSVATAVAKLRPGPKAPRAQCFELGEGGFWLVLAHVPALLEESLAPAFVSAAVCCCSHARAVWENRSLRSLLQLPQDDDVLLALAVERLRVRGSQRVASETAGQTPRRFSVRRADWRDLRDAAAAIGVPAQVVGAVVRMSYVALRAYARRLPGFGTSSNSHLWRNFLLTPATVWGDEGLIRVTLAAPALDVIWRVSGAGKATYTLPDGRFVHTDVRR